MTPEEWIVRCAERLRSFVQDEFVSDAELAACANDMIELRPYRDMSPEAAAEMWAHDFA